MANQPYGKSFAELDIPEMPTGWLPDDLSSDGSAFIVTHEGISLSSQWATLPDGEFDAEGSYSRFCALKKALWTEHKCRAEGKS